MIGDEITLVKLLWRLINQSDIHPSSKKIVLLCDIEVIVSCLWERFFPRSCSLRISSIRVLNKVVCDEGLYFLLGNIVLTG